MVHWRVGGRWRQWWRGRAVGRGSKPEVSSSPTAPPRPPGPLPVVASGTADGKSSTRCHWLRCRHVIMAGRWFWRCDVGGAVGRRVGTHARTDAVCPGSPHASFPHRRHFR